MRTVRPSRGHVKALWTLATATLVGTLSIVGGSTARGEMPSWLAELPPVAKVQAMFGASTPETYAKQSAVFAVLVDVIEVRSGVDQKLNGFELKARLTPEARQRWTEYVAHGYSKTLTSTNGSWQMFVNPTFRENVLSRFLSKAAVAAYEDARNRIPGVPGASNVKSNWRPLEGPQPVAAEAAVPAPPSRPVAPRLSGAMSIFGTVEIGAALTLPSCGTSLSSSVHPGGEAAVFSKFISQTVAETCVGPADAMSNRIARNMLHVFGDLPEDADVRLVNLDHSRCPNWMGESAGCVMAVSLRGGVAGSVGFYTTDQEDTIVKNLVAKFKPSGDAKKSPVDCQTNASSKYGLSVRKGTKYLWTTPQLYVAFWSTGSGMTCDQGSVLITSHAFENAVKKNIERREDSEPKL